jgi:predicted kinase
VVRDRYAALAREDGLAARLHLLDVPVDERWRRVEARDRAGGELDFAITRAMFDFVETMWEPPTAGELAGWDVVRAGS